MNPTSRRSKAHDKRKSRHRHLKLKVSDEAEVIKLLNSWKQNRKLKQNVVQAIRNQHFALEIRLRQLNGHYCLKINNDLVVLDNYVRFTPNCPKFRLFQFKKIGLVAYLN